jgi:hypothetical protein
MVSRSGLTPLVLSQQRRVDLKISTRKCILVDTYMNWNIYLLYFYLFLTMLSVLRLHSVDDRVINEYGTFCGMRIVKEGWSIWRKPALLTFCSPKILTQNWTRRRGRKPAIKGGLTLYKKHHKQLYPEKGRGVMEALNYSSKSRSVVLTFHLDCLWV